MSSFYGIGLMSGSSLDGLDICYAEFTGDVDTDVWGYRILKGMTLEYTKEWSKRLENASQLSGLELVRLNLDYGRFLGQTVEEFIECEDARPCFVASHGHTIFHKPEEHLTYQLGDGETSAAYLDCPFVCNFRTKDVALGGQGAPLVPGGERYLFGNVDVCINLGGIANISLRGEEGYDVCGCNIVLNMLAKKHNGLTHDIDGNIGNTGVILDDVLQKLESLPYYKRKPPKSIGIEWISEHIFPILNTDRYSIPDLLCTYSEHIAGQLTKACSTLQHREHPYTIRRSSFGNGPTPLSVLITGGGAFNRCITDRLEAKLKAEGIVTADTDNDTVQYKEALLFAFLGLRCLLGLQNVSSTITGSSTDSISGSIHLPPKHSQNLLSNKNEKIGFNLSRSESKEES